MDDTKATQYSVGNFFYDFPKLVNSNFVFNKEHEVIIDYMLNYENHKKKRNNIYMLANKID